MKKLIAISVVFALVAGVAFAMDVSGHVIGTAYVLQGDTGKDAAGDSNPVKSSGGMDRIRLDGSGEVADGVFGGYFRVDGVHWSGQPQFAGNAWWKPIDQFKLLIGGNGGDGFIGKEGVTGWMFYQTVTDTGISMGGDNVWGGSNYGFGIKTRNAFYEDRDGDHNVYLFITPMDMLAINIILPFMNNKYSLTEGGPAYTETGDVFKRAVVQVDLKLDFGNIALTYESGVGYSEDEKKPSDDPGQVFVYYGGSFGDLSIDFGLGYKMANAGGESANPIGVGLGVKYATDAFGVKFRTVATLAGEAKTEKAGTRILADVLPYFPLGDNLTAFVSVGIGMKMPEEGDSQMGWHFNPYLQVGEEWGAKFLAGIKVKSNGKGADGSDAVTEWSVPVAVMVSF